MARGVNKVILIGNLGNAPEMAAMPSGDAVAKISIATSESWKDKNTGEQKEKTEWHRVIFFGRLADIVGQYLQKGSKVYIEGKLRTRKWTDQAGVERFTTEIVSNEMQMLDSQQQGAQGGGYAQQAPAQQQQPQHSSQAPRHQQQPAARQPAAPRQQQQPAGGFDNFDDDIPF